MGVVWVYVCDHYLGGGLGPTFLQARVKSSPNHAAAKRCGLLPVLPRQPTTATVSPLSLLGMSATLVPFRRRLAWPLPKDETQSHFECCRCCPEGPGPRRGRERMGPRSIGSIRWHASADPILSNIFTKSLDCRCFERQTVPRRGKTNRSTETIQGRV